MDKLLPVDATALAKQPWVLHVLPVNTLNFCSFALCSDGMPPPQGMNRAVQASKGLKPVLVAVPNTIDSGGVGPPGTQKTLTLTLTSCRLIFISCLQRPVLRLLWQTATSLQVR